MLSPRQELILRLVVDAYLVSARPVGSKEVAEKAEVEWGPSTVRAELAALEAAGYLSHPHTSAGRVPTDSGYRSTSTCCSRRGRRRRTRAVELELSRLRREVDEAMRETTAALAQVTDLVALATAPPEAHRRDDPPGRGAAPALEQGDGGRDRLQRRHRQAGLRFRDRRRPGPGRVGVELPERVAGRDGRRRADDRRPPRRPRLWGRSRPSSSQTLRLGLHRARRRRRWRDPLHGRRRRGCSPTRGSATCPGPTS